MQWYISLVSFWGGGRAGELGSLCNAPVWGVGAVGTNSVSAYLRGSNALWLIPCGAHPCGPTRLHKRGLAYELLPYSPELPSPHPVSCNRWL
eukprot:3071434-Amphidinium_carterae.1